MDKNGKLYTTASLREIEYDAPPDGSTAARDETETKLTLGSKYTLSYHEFAHWTLTASVSNAKNDSNVALHGNYYDWDRTQVEFSVDKMF